MMFVLILFVVLVGGGWLIGSAVGGLFSPKDEIYKEPTKSIFSRREKEPPIINNYYKTENHLHVSKDDLKGIIKKTKTKSKSQ